MKGLHSKYLFRGTCKVHLQVFEVGGRGRPRSDRRALVWRRRELLRITGYGSLVTSLAVSGKLFCRTAVALARPPRLPENEFYKYLLSLSACLFLALCGPSATATVPLNTGSASDRISPKPKPAPVRWMALIGEYGPDDNIHYILEKDGDLCVSIKRDTPKVLTEVSSNKFSFRDDNARQILFVRERNGRAAQMTIHGTVYKRRRIEPAPGTALKVSPVRPVPELIKEALTAQPPVETGERRKPELVELIKLDRSIRLDIRYATRNNLFGTVFYSQPRAFLQRPAAEALVRINKRLKSLGYGLLVHDAYRPWYVTKVFWDATPQEKKIFVADPSRGSRHNRGAAVDITLYDLRTLAPIEMVGTYDETTDRSYPDYPGGTSLQRWSRDLLRSAMEAEGFTVYEAEWWHFDYNDWQLYPILNIRFEGL